MPATTRDGVTLHYETAADDAAETVAFVGTAGYGAWQWSFQSRVTGPYRTLVYDHRGTGRSTAAPPYDVATLAADLEAVLAAADAAGATLVGAGLGGAVALRYAHEHGRADRLALFGTAPDGDAVDADALHALVEPGLAGALSPAFREANPDLLDRVADWRAADDAAPEVAAEQAAAWLAFEAPPLYEVLCPALVVHGTDDPVVPTDAGRRLAADLPRGEFVAAEGHHLAHVESARAVTDRLLAFLAGDGAGD